MRLLPYLKILITLSAVAFSGFVSAQQSVKFSSLTWDYGDIKEDGGKVEHTFTFTNVGSEPLSLVRVTSNCGCTTPEYSRTPIAVGGQGRIKVLYDPMDRPGRFSKNIVVKTSAGDDLTLVVEGNVLPRQKSIEEIYPFDMGGGVRLASNFHAFSYVGRGERVEQTIAWINTSKIDARVAFHPEQRSGLFTIDAPAMLAAGKSGELTMVYDVPASSALYGTLNDVVSMKINGATSRVKLSANVIAVDRYERLAEDISLPSLTLSKKIIKFAEVKYPDMVSDSTIELTNEGGSDLIIRAVEYPAGVVDCSLKAGDRLRPGESRKLKITFRSGECSYGPFSERMRIITNDVVRPMQSLRVTAIVVSK